MINLPRSASRESNCEDCGHVASSHRADDCWDCDRDARHCDGFLWFGVRYVEEVHPVTREMVKGRTVRRFFDPNGNEYEGEPSEGDFRYLDAPILVAQDAVGSADD